MRAAIVLVAVLAAFPAAAADLYFEEEPMLTVAAAGDWEGAYVGVQVGGQIVNVTSSPGYVQPGGHGLIAGAHIGYNHQIDSFVLGVEADAEYSSFAATEECDTPTWDCSTYLNWQGSLRGRAGYAVESALFYLTGGLAVANFGGETYNTTTDDGFPDSSVRFGYTVGAGVEIGVAENVTGRIEYRYSDFGTRDMNYDILYEDVGVRTHAVRFGISVGL